LRTDRDYEIPYQVLATPLAIAVIGGLTASTSLTLFFIPVLYTEFEEKFRREMKVPEVE
jgi:Cu/Ag efflux pump CusA